MTRIAYLDLIGGVAGDMLRAALIDAGASATTVFEGLGALGLAHREPHLEEVLRRGFRALHLMRLGERRPTPPRPESRRLVERVQIPPGAPRPTTAYAASTQTRARSFRDGLERARSADRGGNRHRPPVDGIGGSANWSDRRGRDLRRRNCV